MSPADARKYLAALGHNQGNPPPDPTSMEEVLTILRTDDVRRFEGATRFTEGLQGAEGLSVRAMIELMTSDIYATGDRLVTELGRRLEAELKRLAEKQESGIALTDAEKADEKALKERHDVFSQSSMAMAVLAREHLHAGGALAIEAVKQYPQSQEGYRVAAYYYLLKNDWLRYDDMMAPLEGQDDAVLSYFVALENLHRNADKEDCRTFLQKALEQNPQMVRAQALLVLVQDDIDGRYDELQKLKKMKPDHPIVITAGAMIEAEYETSQSVRNAMADSPSEK